MEDHLPPSLRIVLRGLALAAFVVALTWSVRSFSYEPVIAVISAASAVLIIFATGRSSAYETIFGLARVVAFTLCMGILSMGIVCGVLWLVGVEKFIVFALAGGMVGATAGFIKGIHMSLKGVSVQPVELMARAAILLSLMVAFLLLQLLLPMPLQLERFTLIEFLLMLPVLFFVSVLLVVLWEDIRMLDAEIREARERRA